MHDTKKQKTHYMSKYNKNVFAKYLQNRKFVNNRNQFIIVSFEQVHKLQL